MSYRSLRIRCRSLAAACAAFLVACDSAPPEAVDVALLVETASRDARAGRFEAALEALDRGLAAEPGNVAAYLLRGAVLERLDRLEAADAAYAEAARLSPEHPNPPLHRARIARMRELDAALAAARTALPDAADPAAAHRALGELLLERRRPDAAARQFQRVLRHDPDDVDAHAGLGVALVRQRREVRALYHASEALRLRPHDERALGELVWILATSSEPTLRDVPTAIARAEASPTRTSRLLDALAAAYAAAGRSDDAARTARTAIEHAEQEGRHGEAHAIQARLALYERGRPFVGPPVDPG